MTARIAPGGTVGILGGGQLGRMLAIAAAELGLKTHIYAAEDEAPARDVASLTTQAAYDDEAALLRFAERVDVITYEFENVPAATAHLLSDRKPVRPGHRALAITQDRWDEKSFLRANAIETARTAPIVEGGDITAAAAITDLPAILKTRRFGYDGKGQRRVTSTAEINAALAEFAVPAILESFEPFARELSLIAARGLDGTIAAYDLVENRHENHILSRTLAPAHVSPAQTETARQMAAAILQALDYVGVLTIELFEMPDGRMLVNELAPRVHNSGHWTLEACAVSQFSQHIRAVCGWPLGDPARHADAVMENLIGPAANDWPRLAATKNAALHLYGKAEARPGRKMGHLTRIYPLGARPDG